LIFLTRVGLSGAPSLLKRETIAAMMTTLSPQPGLCEGLVRGQVGRLLARRGVAGARSSIERTTNGLCWAALANTDCEMDLNPVVWDMVHEVKAWRVRGASDGSGEFLRHQGRDTQAVAVSQLQLLTRKASRGCS
jgi:hypothetical protein